MSKINIMLLSYFLKYNIFKLFNVILIPALNLQLDKCYERVSRVIDDNDTRPILSKLCLCQKSPPNIKYFPENETRDSKLSR